jgi:methyl-accepting chemotaxis protein
MAASIEEVALNVENLAQSVDDVSSSIIQMAAAIKHISDSVNGLIDSSTVTASSVIQMDSSIRQVEKNALDTAAISEQVRKDAESGKASVEATITGMQEIKRSSHITHEVIDSLSQKAGDIGTILSVINEVAEQTNLLALNAAIEAARAGETGRGFAVVADEVRKLAERTAKSTSEITDMVGAIQRGVQEAVSSMHAGVSRVSDGVRLTREAGDTMGRIRTGAGDVVRMVSDISSALREQSAAATEIARNVEHIAQMSEQNSAAVADNAVTVGQLDRLAGGLQTEVSRFKV